MAFTALRTLAIAAVAAVGFAGAAQADTPTLQFGVLDCDLESTSNLLVISERTFDCSFEPSDGGAPHGFKASITKYGIDAKIAEDTAIVWLVVAPTIDAGPEAIAGDYLALQADAAIAGGAGGRILVGGLNDSVSLQPVATSFERGFGVAIGVETLSLEHTGAM